MVAKIGLIVAIKISDRKLRGGRSGGKVLRLREGLRGPGPKQKQTRTGKHQRRHVWACERKREIQVARALRLPNHQHKLPSLFSPVAELGDNLGAGKLSLASEKSEEQTHSRSWVTHE